VAGAIVSLTGMGVTVQLRGLSNVQDLKIGGG